MIVRGAASPRTESKIPASDTFPAVEFRDEQPAIIYEIGKTSRADIKISIDEPVLAQKALGQTLVLIDRVKSDSVPLPLNLQPRGFSTSIIEGIDRDGDSRPGPFLTHESLREIGSPI